MKKYRHNHLMKAALYIAILLLGLVIVQAARSEDLPLYPNPDFLGPYELGNDGEMIDESIELVFIHELVGDGRVNTAGAFIINEKYDLINLDVSFVVTNGDKRIMKELVVVEQASGTRIVNFEVEYDYDPGYEYCVFQINIMLQLKPKEDFINVPNPIFT